MDIVVSFKKKWGKELFYPESEDAFFLSKFTGRPTLLKHQLKLALERGWKVKVIQKQFDLDEDLNTNMPRSKEVKNDR